MFLVRGPGILPTGIHFSKVLNMVALYGKSKRALIFEDLFFLNSQWSKGQGRAGAH
jgi:hypothetical protein